MSGGDELTSHVNAQIEDSVTAEGLEPRCLESSDQKSELERNDEQKQNDPELKDRITNSEHGLVQIPSYVKKPVRTLIDLYENPKSFKTDTDRVSAEISRPVGCLPDLVQIHDKFILEQEIQKSHPEVSRVTQRPRPSSAQGEEVLSLEEVTALENGDPCASAPSGDSDPYHTVRATQNLFKVESRVELEGALESAGSQLVFLFFFPDNCDLDEPFKKCFLPKVEELSCQYPKTLFLTVYIDLENRGWEEWSPVVQSFKTSSIVGPTFLLFQNQQRIHEAEAYGTKALGNMVSDLIAKHRQDPALSPALQLPKSVNQDYLHVLPESGSVNLECVQVKAAFGSDAHLKNVLKGKKKSPFRTMLRLIPIAVHKVVGEVTGAVDELLREFVVPEEEKRETDESSTTGNAKVIPQTGRTHEAEATILIQDWKYLIVSPDSFDNFGILPSTYVQSLGRRQDLEDYLNAAGATLVILTFYTHPATNISFETTVLPVLENSAAQNPDVSFLCARLFPEAWASNSIWPGLFFFKNAQLIHEEQLRSIWILVNKLPNLIQKLK